MELASPKIKKFLIFSQNKFFLYFGKWNFLALNSNFSSKKILIFLPKKARIEKELLYFLSLLTTSLINNSGLIFMYANVFTCGEEVGKLAV